MSTYLGCQKRCSFTHTHPGLLSPSTSGSHQQMTHPHLVHGSTENHLENSHSHQSSWFWCLKPASHAWDHTSPNNRHCDCHFTQKGFRKWHVAQTSEVAGHHTLAKFLCACREASQIQPGHINDRMRSSGQRPTQCWSFTHLSPFCFIQKTTEKGRGRSPHWM